MKNLPNEACTLHEVLDFIEKAKETQIRVILFKLHQSKHLKTVFDKREPWLKQAYKKAYYVAERKEGSMKTTPATENLIKVGNVILDNEAIELLEDYQHCDNEAIKSKVNFYANTICFIAGNLYLFSEKEKEEAMEILQGLANRKDEIIKFKKP